MLALEALALAAAAVWYVVGLLTSTPVSLGGAIFMVVLLAALAVLMGAVAYQHFRGYRWTRSAAFVWQLVMVAIAMPILLAGQILAGIVLGVPALVVLVLLFSPKAVEYTLRTGGHPPVL
ncbi:hypothetical protein ACQCSX_08940 [Pseudarthrobacter sp. P1]|uniref:hypothetical protein n=1 Tax=Pseudarthrobacter sp. P1 TaxID=3418418 RepID=UPI003CE90C07